MKTNLRPDQSCARGTAKQLRSRSGKWRWLGGSLLVSASLAVGGLVGVLLHAPGRVGEVVEPSALSEQPGARSKVRGLAQQPSSQPDTKEGADRVQPEETVGTIYSNLAMLHQTKGELDQAESMYKKAIEMNKAWDHRASMAKDYNNLGFVYWSRGELKQAETVFLNSLELHKTLGDQAGMADNYANLGSVYLVQGELAKAEVRYRQALALNRVTNRKVKLANNYNNLGMVFQTRGELKKAHGMHQKAITIYQGVGSQTDGLASAYVNLGSVYKHAGDVDEAKEMYGRALRLYRRAGNRSHARRTEVLLSALREANEQTASALKPTRSRGDLRPVE